MSSDIFDVIIIGGGASGLFTALRINDLCPDKSVAVIEANPQLGKKLKLTGNGRCNFTNTALKIDEYNSDDSDKLRRIIDSFPPNAVIDYFYDNLGVIHYNIGDLVYPLTLMSDTVVRAFERKIFGSGIKVILNSKVNKLLKDSDGYKICFNDDTLCSRYVVVACGGCSYPKTGSDGNFYRNLLPFADRSSFVQVTPGLVQLKTRQSDIFSLKGIRIKATCSLYCDDFIVKEEAGELLFTDYGISGIAVMQLSSKAVAMIASGKKPYIMLNILNGMSSDDVRRIITDMIHRDGNASVTDALSGIITEKLLRVVLSRTDLDPDTKCEAISESRISSVTECICHFRLDISGSNGFDEAQITVGGLKLSALTDECELKSSEGLFVCGEIINADGPCGGYNLQWAMSSGNKVAEAVAKRLI